MDGSVAEICHLDLHCLDGLYICFGKTFIGNCLDGRLCSGDMLSRQSLSFPARSLLCDTSPSLQQEWPLGMCFSSEIHNYKAIFAQWSRAEIPAQHTNESVAFCRGRMHSVITFDT